MVIVVPRIGLQATRQPRMRVLYKVILPQVQNPEQSGQTFRFKADTHSGGKRTPVPI